MTPVIAFCGPGRSGKGEASTWFADNTILRYSGSCSYNARFYMAKRLSEIFGREVTCDEAFANRHENRMLWYKCLNEYREQDPTLLIKDCLKDGDIVDGIRDHRELFAALDQDLITLAVWIERPVPHDPTITYCKQDCHIVIENNLTLHSYHNKLYHLAKALGVLN